MTSAPDGTSLTSSAPVEPASTPAPVGATAAPQRFTEPQNAYLTGRIPDYRRAQVDKSWDDTWANIHGGFIREWPQGPLTAAEVTAGVTREDKLIQELKRIKVWYNNHGREGQEAHDILDLGGKTKRALSAWQAYMKLYYKDKLKSIVDARYEQARKDVQSGIIEATPPMVKFRNDVVRELFAAEPAKVHEEVAQFVLKYKQAQGDGDISSGGDENGDGEGDQKTSDAVNAQAEAYLHAQKALPRTLARALKQILDQTGYVGGIALAGPDPEAGGSIKTISLFSGRFGGVGGFDWGQHYSARRWKENVEDPLVDFTLKVYPPEIRAGFALTGATVSSRAPSLALSRSGSASRAPSAVPSASKAAAPSLAPPSKPAVTSKTNGGAKSRAKRSKQLESTDSPSLNLAENDDSFDLAEAMELDDDPDADSPASPNAEQLETTSTRPKPRTRGPLEQWELDDSLTVKERKEIKAQRSGYEREKQYNIVRNARVLRALKIPETTKGLARMCGKPSASVSKADSGRNSVWPGGKKGTEDLSRAESPLAADTTARSTRDNTSTSSFDKALSNSFPFDTTSSASDLEDAIRELDEFLGGDESSNTSNTDHGAQESSEKTASLNINAPTNETLSTDGLGDSIDEEARDFLNHATSALAATAQGSPEMSLVDGHPDITQWADWMEPAVRAMEKMVDEKAWSHTLLKWLSFEKLMGYPSGRAKKVLIAAQSRPDAITAWIRGGRQVDQMPDLTVVADTFGKEWWAWWAHLLNGRLAEFPQPSLEVPSPKLEDVQEVMKGGANGIFLLLLSLSWWGLAVLDQDEDKVSAWKHAFEDFRCILTLMHDHLSSSTIKRPGEELEGPNGKRSRNL